MAKSETIVGEISYYPSGEADAKYSDIEDMIEIMRDGDSEVVEFRVNPSLSRKGDDQLYIRIPAQVLMAALVKVMLDIPKREG